MTSEVGCPTIAVDPIVKSAGTKRERDKAVILAVVKRFGPVSRVAIHQLTHLRANTISLLTRELLREGRLLEAGLSDNPLGRKQVLLRLNENLGYMVGVEFDAEFVIAGAMDLHPRILSEVREATVLSAGVVESSSGTSPFTSTDSVSWPTSSMKSRRMDCPSLSAMPARVTGRKPSLRAMTRYSPLGSSGTV